MKRTGLLGALLGCGVLLGAGGAIGGVAQAAACQLDHAGRQVCGSAVSARAGQVATLKVASYEDLSACDFAPPADEPGNNGRYVVGTATVDWGDGSRTTSVTAQTGPSCEGTASENEVGSPASVLGRHAYKRPGVYRASVLLIYRRGAGNSYQNCATITGGPVYNVLSNCVAYGGPVTTTVTVKPQLEKVPNLKGDTLTQARAALIKAHLVLGHVSQRGHASRPVVTAQTAKAAASIPRGSKVGVTLR